MGPWQANNVTPRLRLLRLQWPPSRTRNMEIDSDVKCWDRKLDRYDRIICFNLHQGPQPIHFCSFSLVVFAIWAWIRSLSVSVSLLLTHLNAHVQRTKDSLGNGLQFWSFKLFQNLLRNNLASQYLQILHIFYKIWHPRYIQ